MRCVTLQCLQVAAIRMQNGMEKILGVSGRSLKTASSSQCRDLSVASKYRGKRPAFELARTPSPVSQEGRNRS